MTILTAYGLFMSFINGSKANIQDLEKAKNTLYRQWK
jgi:hypothetical protein